MAKRQKRSKLTLGAEKLALQLLFVASGGNVGLAQAPDKEGVINEINVSFSDRRALLDSVTKLIEKQHKMKPEAEDVDGISAYKDMLNGPSGESRDRGVGASETAISLSDADSSRD